MNQSINKQIINQQMPEFRYQCTKCIALLKSYNNVMLFYLKNIPEDDRWYIQEEYFLIVLEHNI